MTFVGIDLSLNSTGLVCLTNESEEMKFNLITPDVKKLSSEERLDYNATEIFHIIDTYRPDVIGLEDLSYNSISSSKDEIAANFWRIRCEIRRCFPSTELRIVPVLSWRSPLFNKGERDKLRDDTKLVNTLKKDLKGVKDRILKAEKLKENEDLILNANIKYLTFRKLPPEVQMIFGEYGYSKGTFDLSDAWHLTNFIRKQK